MRPAALAALVVGLHVAAVSLPCPPAAESASRASAAEFAAGALHATHAGSNPDGVGGRDVRAPCPCPCRDGAPGDVASARLGPALLRAAPALAHTSGTTPLARSAPALADAPPATPDPVPRPA